MKVLVFVAVSLLFLGCQAKQSLDPMQEVEDRRDREAREYQVQEISAENLVELFDRSKEELLRLLETIEDQELFRGRNPSVARAKRQVQAWQGLVQEDPAQAPEHLNRMIDLCRDFSRDASFRQAYRRHFSRLESRIRSEFRRLSR